MAEEDTPRPLTKIVCAYDLGALPTWWVMVHRSIKTRLERAGARVRVELTPLSSFPQDADLVVIPAELAVAAVAVAPNVECFAIGKEDHGGGVARLLEHLAQDARFEMSEPSELTTEDAKPIISRWVGSERID